MLQYFDEFYMTDEQKIIENNCSKIFELLKSAYWAKDRSELITLSAIQNSLNYAIFETNSERLIGFARVVTDYSTVYYLSDVYIDEEFRGRGLGKKLVEWIILHEKKLSGINGLLKTRDAVNLYKKYGFEECKAICMVRVDRDKI